MSNHHCSLCLRDIILALIVHLHKQGDQFDYLFIGDERVPSQQGINGTECNKKLHRGLWSSPYNVQMMVQNNDNSRLAPSKPSYDSELVYCDHLTSYWCNSIRVLLSRRIQFLSHLLSLNVSWVYSGNRTTDAYFSPRARVMHTRASHIANVNEWSHCSPLIDHKRMRLQAYK